MPEPITDPSLQQAIKDVQTPPRDAVPIEVRLPQSGRTYKGGSEREVLDQLVHAQDSATLKIQEQNAELERLRQTQAAPAQQAPISEDDKVNAIYWEKWQKSPVAAQNYIDSVRLGVPEDQVPQVLRGTLQQTHVAQQQQAGADFQQRCPDFPNTPEATSALIQSMRQRYGNRPAVDAAELADRLEVTYGQLVRSGSITPTALPITHGGGGPIPALGGGHQSQVLDATNEADFRRLSPEKMKEVIERLQAQGRR